MTTFTRQKSHFLTQFFLVLFRKRKCYFIFHLLATLLVVKKLTVQPCCVANVPVHSDPMGSGTIVPVVTLVEVTLANAKPAAKPSIPVTLADSLTTADNIMIPMRGTARYGAANVSCDVESRVSSDSRTPTDATTGSYADGNVSR